MVHYDDIVRAAKALKEAEVEVASYTIGGFLGISQEAIEESTAWERFLTYMDDDYEIPD